MRTFSVRKFGLEAGDRVKPTSEYENFFHKSFYAIIVYFHDDVAVLEKDNGERVMIACYWLEKVVCGES